MFGDRRLEEDLAAWWQECTDGAGDGEAFSLGLPCVLEAEVVHACSNECEGDVCDAFTEGATDVEGACMEVRVLAP